VAFVFKVLCVPRSLGARGQSVDHVRLFRNLPGLAWEHRIHEQILPPLKRRGATPRWADVVVQHIGYQNPKLQPRSWRATCGLLHLEYQEQPNHPYTLFKHGPDLPRPGQGGRGAGLLSPELARVRGGRFDRAQALRVYHPV